MFITLKLPTRLIGRAGINRGLPLFTPKKSTVLI